MNQTEQKAYNWLLAHGAKENSIVFQQHKSPDFITNLGNFEVKHAEGQLVILTQNQICMLESNDVTFLVYIGHNEEPLVLSSSEFIKRFRIHIFHFVEGRPKNITIREDQAKWITDKHINLSRFVQAKLDEEMKK